MERLQCGAFAGLIAQSVTYPIEVTRRRMQTLGLVAGNDTAFGNVEVATSTVSNNATKVAASSAGTGTGAASAAIRQQLPPPPSLMSTIRSLYVEQGVHGFFKGVSLNWMKGPVAFAISFTTFDTVQSWLETESERSAVRRH